MSRVAHERRKRPKPPEQVPLDVGSVDGADAWRDVEGVAFCHWDRWLLRLALEDADGVRAISKEFRRRVQQARGEERVAEAMLAQIADLEKRLATLGLEPAQVLDDIERASKWLLTKAQKRVWEAKSLRRTAAMERTPRKVMEEQALTGRWDAFPVSPVPYFMELRAVVGNGWYEWRATGAVVTLLDLAARRQLGAVTTDAERLAVHRAMLSASIDAMGRIDDSDNELGQLAREHEKAYLEVARGFVERPGILADLLELAVWEDYGLFQRVDSFLGSLSEDAANEALRELARILAELRAPGLSYYLNKARRLRRAVLASAERLEHECAADS